mmetsp:Transcript_7451/g.32873  ORF Transcript_7451/g.32873 Transcript_7451/m.32873 type:complete len:231 (+) Transcript_7451:519-1211(+)
MRRDGRRRLGLELELVLLKKLVVRVVRVLLHLFAQVVRHAGRHQVHGARDEVVKDGHVLREEAVGEAFIAAHALHDEQVVKLVHRLREVHLQVVRPAPESERLVQVKHGEEGEVRDPGDRLERVKSRVVPSLVELVDDEHRGPDDGGVDRALGSRDQRLVLNVLGVLGLVVIAQARELRRRLVLLPLAPGRGRWVGDGSRGDDARRPAVGGHRATAEARGRDPIMIVVRS